MKHDMSGARHEITWTDAGREPKCPSHPAFPDGVDLDCSMGAERTCVVDLPYPAPRIGHHSIRCTVCGAHAVCSTAGRADDPRSIKIPCKETIQ